MVIRAQDEDEDVDDISWTKNSKTVLTLLGAVEEG